MSAKQQRHHAILRLLSAESISSHAQLRDLLASEGLHATQATLSRDLEELGAIKIRTAGGDSIYAVPEYEPARIAPGSQLRRVLGEWAAEVKVSGHLVVIRTPPGCAHVVASALDRSGMVGLLGTVAGDDTVLCVASEETGGRALATDLRSMAGLSAHGEGNS